MNKLLITFTNPSCAQLEKYAFNTHVDCYLDPGFGAKSICDIWATRNTVGLLKTFEVKDFFKSSNALSQVRSSKYLFQLN